MLTIRLLPIILFSIILSSEQWIELSNSTDNIPSIDVISSNDKNIQLSFNLDGFYLNSVIIDNQELMIRDLLISRENFKRHFPDKDSTWGYHYYNIFVTTAPSPVFYELYKELNKVIRGYIGDDRPLWMQSWLNFHMSNEVLGWHNHEWSHHGILVLIQRKQKLYLKNMKLLMKWVIYTSAPPKGNIK